MKKELNILGPIDLGPIDGENDEFLLRYLPGRSEAVMGLRERIARLNSSQRIDLVRTILIRGETGVGKNHVARVIAGHRRYWRIDNPRGDFGLDAGLRALTTDLLEIQLPAIPDTLVESELFGHKRGAFTGADRDKEGLLAGKSRDILLDEIGDISAPLQAKLLGVVESGRFRRVGATEAEDRRVNARLMMATNRPLESFVREGRFREDLYFRIRAFVVTVPPLREQPENIWPIARQIEGNLLRNLSSDINADKESRLSPSDVRWAESYEWPGNIRELEHSITRWLFEDCRHSLKTVVEVLREEDRKETGSLDVTSAIAELVRARINLALEGKALPPGTLNSLVKEFEREVKGAVSSWNRSFRPTDDQLRSVFPEHGTLASIRNKLSQWRKK